jgi:phosphate-selective porin OprO/OprP
MGRRILSVVTACTLLLCRNELAAQDFAAEFDSGDGLRISSRDDAFQLRLDGRLHLDSAQFEEDVSPLADATKIRRARVRADFHFGDDWRLRADRDVGGVVEGWKSLYLEYRGFRRTRLTLGNQLVPFSLDELTGSNDTMFMERALPNALSPGILTGLTYAKWRGGWSLAGGVFGNDLSAQDRRQSTGRGVAMRVTAAPVREENRTVHFGAAFELRQPNELRFRERPESYTTSTRLLDTGSIAGVDDTLTIGLESAAVLGAFQIQGEYLMAEVNRKDASALSFDGWYLAASYVLDGQARSYSRRSGRFGAVEANRTRGAWELAARYSVLDLNDQELSGGYEENTTLGLNWYAHSNFRLMLNYVWIDAAPNSEGIYESPNILEFRFQAAL